ncbi:MAG: putative Sec-independent protein translocase protein TatB [Actinomycetota bacterium]
MFNLQGGELLIILVLALVVLGPEKLPEAMRRIGRAYAELRRMGAGFSREFRDVVEEPAADVRRMMRETAETVDGIVRAGDPDTPVVGDAESAEDAGPRRGGASAGPGQER